MIPGQALARALGSPVRRQRPVAGGDVNQAARVELEDGRLLFVKHRLGPVAGMYEAEARGLRWLGQAGALRLPGVLAVAPGFLALEWIEPGSPTARTWELLGEGLAALHRSGPQRFGGPDGFIATLEQPGGQSDSWASFYGERRLRPQVERMLAGGLGLGLRPALERLLASLEERVGPPEPPARLHGDLWGGNLLVAAGGEPVLVDPASYAGHREVDLAMMRLFGGFDARTFQAYDAACPLAPGWRERVPLYQLYFLVVHVNLFGGGWLSRVERCLAELR